jgi:hypothetical protein
MNNIVSRLQKIDQDLITLQNERDKLLIDKKELEIREQMELEKRRKEREDIRIAHEQELIRIAKEELDRKNKLQKEHERINEEKTDLNIMISKLVIRILQYVKRKNGGSHKEDCRIIRHFAMDLGKYVYKSYQSYQNYLFRSERDNYDMVCYLFAEHSRYYYKILNMCDDLLFGDYKSVIEEIEQAISNNEINA